MITGLLADIGVNIVSSLISEAILRGISSVRPNPTTNMDEKEIIKLIFGTKPFVAHVQSGSLEIRPIVEKIYKELNEDAPPSDSGFAQFIIKTKGRPKFILIVKMSELLNQFEKSPESVRKKALNLIGVKDIVDEGKIETAYDWFTDFFPTNTIIFITDVGEDIISDLQLHLAEKTAKEFARKEKILLKRKIKVNEAELLQREVGGMFVE